MKNKRITTICGSISIIVIIIIGSIIFLANKKNGDSTNSNNSIVSVGKAIKEIQNIQEKLQNENLDKENPITRDNGLKCYEYKDKEDITYIASNFSKLFYSVLNNKGGIILTQDKENQNETKLYVCLADGCEFEKIENYEIVKDDPQEKVIGINTQKSPVAAYVYKQYEDGEWKFDKPIISCK